MTNDRETMILVRMRRSHILSEYHKQRRSSLGLDTIILTCEHHAFGRFSSEATTRARLVRLNNYLPLQQGKCHSSGRLHQSRKLRALKLVRNKCPPPSTVMSISIKQYFIGARSVEAFGPPEEEKGVQRILLFLAKKTVFLALDGICSMSATNLYQHLANTIPFGSFQCFFGQG